MDIIASAFIAQGALVGIFLYSYYRIYNLIADTEDLDVEYGETFEPRDLNV